MFAHTRAATVAVPSTKALPVSVRRNSRSAVRLCQTVRPANSDPDDSAAALSADDASLTVRTLSHRSLRFLYRTGRGIPPRSPQCRILVAGGADGPDVSERRRDARRAGALHDRGGAADRRAPDGPAVPVLLGPR